MPSDSYIRHFLKRFSRCTCEGPRAVHQRRSGRFEPAECEDVDSRHVDPHALTTEEILSDKFKKQFDGYDLQRFAAEDEGRTEDPTDRRKREERDKGNVARSQDIPAAGVLLGSVVVLFFTGTYILSQIHTLFNKYLGMDYRTLQNLTDEDVRRLMLDLFFESGKIAGPIMIVAVVMAVASNILQVGLLFTLQPLQVKWERIVPDFKRILPNRRTAFSLGKIILQTIFIGGIAYLVIVDDFFPMLKTSQMDLNQAISLFAVVAFKLMVIASLVLVVLSIPDYFYQRFEYIENLKITMSELKRERRDEEGDPMIRQRQRDRAYELRQQRNMLQEVPRADVVITNPTHFAVALEYDSIKASAPIVIAKGADHLAFLIRNIAKENNIPVEENPHLARMLYKDVDIGQEIPESLYRVVSIIFAKLNRFRSGSL
ncbi:MAG: flagellar biosynthesis protein FlhB [Spirochaetia bacterium]|nr:flagellar biosynthesis protein FlhB [Spirochaetia bacterium]